MSGSLVDLLTRYIGAQTHESPFFTEIEGLTLLRSDVERSPVPLIYKPSLCVVVQGAKQSLFGRTQFDCRAGQALLVSVEIPASGRVVGASPKKPFLGVVIELDIAILGQVMSGLASPPSAEKVSGPGVFLTNFSGPMADCAMRMVHLLSSPEAIPVLYPTIMRELCYWLLTGPHGGEIAKLALASAHGSRMINAIHALRNRFTEQVRIEELAAIAQLSASAFHRQFKTLTSMTPLQYQKHLRLLEARRLMMSDVVNAETAALRVGYESASQFSREYSRLFGNAPRRDVLALRVAR